MSHVLYLIYYLLGQQCDQIGRFIATWAPFSSLWQQCWTQILEKGSNSALCNFWATRYTHWATFYSNLLVTL